MLRLSKQFIVATRYLSVAVCPSVVPVPLTRACFTNLHCLPQVEFAFNDYNDADRTLGDWDNFARRCSPQL